LLRSSQRPSPTKKSFVSTRGLLRIFLPRGRSLLCFLCAERDAPITRFEKPAERTTKFHLSTRSLAFTQNQAAIPLVLFGPNCVLLAAAAAATRSILICLARFLLAEKKENHVTRHKTRAARNETYKPPPATTVSPSGRPSLITGHFHLFIGARKGAAYNKCNT
jgi:hypothetical protein